MPGSGNFEYPYYRSILLFSTATALVTNTAARARVTGALFSASCSCSIRSSSWMEAWCTVVRFLLVRRVNNLRVLLFLFSFFSNSIYDSTRVELPVPVGHYLVVPKKTTIRTLSADSKTENPHWHPTDVVRNSWRHHYCGIISALRVFSHEFSVSSAAVLEYSVLAHLLRVVRSSRSFSNLTTKVVDSVHFFARVRILKFDGTPLL